MKESVDVVFLLLIFFSCSTEDSASAARVSALKLSTQAVFKKKPKVKASLSSHAPVNLEELQRIFGPLWKKSPRPFVIRAFANPFHDTSSPSAFRLVSGAYVGGTYDPVNNQIVFVPFGQGDAEYWHRYDCASQTVQVYPNPFHRTSHPTDQRVLPAAYHGGVYDPVNNQIVFVPMGQGGEAYWHRYDCATRQIEAYANPFHASASPPESRVVIHAYFGGVYDPLNREIVFVPREQADQHYWHRYDCETQQIEAYVNPFHASASPVEEQAVNWAYAGGSYDPVNQKVVFAPYEQGPELHWHRYDSQTRQIEVYENPFHVGSTAVLERALLASYSGASYDGLNRKVVFHPFVQSDRAYWHRYDCASEEVESYENPFPSSTPSQAVSGGYVGGAHSVRSNQIFLSPFAQAEAESWHFYDCATQTVKAYPNSYQSSLSYGDYVGGVWDPWNNEVIFVPYENSRQTWHAIRHLGGGGLNRQLASHFLFNSF